MKFRLQTSPLRIRDILLWSFITLAMAALRAGDWPQYRGPNHDGLSTETIRANWSGEPPRKIWKVPLDPGLSSFSVSGGRVFTLVRRSVSGQGQEFCIALDSDTGEELWASDALGRAYYPDAGVGIDDGPRSTPSVEGDRVYVLTSYLRLYCLSITNGATIWIRDLMTEYGSDVIDWQSAASPLLEGDLVFVFADAPNQCLLAFHKSDGSEAWKGQNDVMTQASPIAATIAGVRQVIFFAKSGLVSVAPASGSVLWRYPFPFSTSTAASPVVGVDAVYCSAAYGSGSGVVRISSSGGQLAASQVWRIPGGNMNHWATPVLHNGYLFGIYGQQGPGVSLRCIDFATGTEKWRQSGVGTGGGVLFVTGHVLVLTEDGNLLLVKPDPNAYGEAARLHALDGSQSSIAGLVRCWNVPAISNGRIYARSTTEAVCLDVAVAALSTNRPPLGATNLAPPDGETNQLLTLTLRASAFDDPDGDSHASSHWIIKRSLDDTVVFDSGNDTNNKTSIAVPAGFLSNSTAYSWSVSYTDANNAQGPVSTPTLFTTQPLAPIKLFSTLTSGTGLFQLLIGDADGSPLDTNRAAGIDVFASTDLTLGLSGWIKLNSSLTLTNDHLSLDDPQSPASAQRFFRVEERP
jgi:outer membrane protein assembly factor BamB